MPRSSGKDLPAAMAALGADIVGVLGHGVKSKERRGEGGEGSVAWSRWRQRGLVHITGGEREIETFFPTYQWDCG